ncbi:hypothetical protein [Streptomyces albiflavescens]|nr:hypothetical protein [Streptomyces albiflavescens]
MTAEPVAAEQTEDLVRPEALADEVVVGLGEEEDARWRWVAAPADAELRNLIAPLSSRSSARSNARS